MEPILERMENNSSKTIRVVRVVLLVLILVGLALLFTQKKWVPPLVDAILKYEQKA